jgi:hypothetical protein
MLALVVDPPFAGFHDSVYCSISLIPYLDSESQQYVISWLALHLLDIPHYPDRPYDYG